MKILALKLCQECGIKRSYIDRLFCIDNELCDNCYFELVKAVRERHD